ncbi:MAG: creatininase family protein, partial [Rectinemataceae bacterium]
MSGFRTRFLIEEMTWPEIRAAIDAGADTIVIAVGAVEQHGPHLAEGTDSFMGESYAIEIAARLGNALVAPVIRPGISPHHMGFPGTVTLRESTLVAIMEDYVASYVHHGFTRFQFFCSHGGNYEAVARAVARFRDEYTKCDLNFPFLIELLKELGYDGF